MSNAIERAEKKFWRLVRERDKLTAELVRIRHYMSARANVEGVDWKRRLEDLDEAVWPPSKITGAVALVLRLDTKWRTPTEIRDLLEELGVDLRRLSFPMGNVHSALQRLDRINAVEIQTHADGCKEYRWKVQR